VREKTGLISIWQEELEDLLKQFMQSSQQNYKNVETSLKNLFNFFFLNCFFVS